MSNNITMTTSQILNKFNLTRQTLYNWEKDGLISIPDRDWRGWRIWTPNIIKEIECLINNKKLSKPKITRNIYNGGLLINSRRYLGAKTKLVPFIEYIVKSECGDFKVFSDIFGGTGVVGYAFNRENNKIIINDILYSNYISYQTWFGNGIYNKKKIEKLINEFNSIEVKEDNYVSENFGGCYFTIENARKIGYVRETIDNMKSELTERENAILITSLLYAADKVANTCGHYDAFRRKLDAKQRLELQMPIINDLNNKHNEIYREDANELVKKISSDITYIDTPYNSRQYADAYHLLENIALWQKPKVEGVAKKMIDRSNIKSKYCTVKAPSAFSNLIENLDTKYILVSYNNMASKGNGRSNAKISDEEILETLNKKGKVKIFDTDFQYFTTGKTKLTDHKERVFVCKCR